MNGVRLLSWCAIGAMLLCDPSAGWAQQDHPMMSAAGFQPDRDYFSEMPFENIDTLSGGLVLTFTDLVLPGNAGRELRFQRTYNSKTGSWSFGVAGIAMYVSEPPLPPGIPDVQEATPTLWMSDGSSKPMAWFLSPTVSLAEAISRDFWKFNRISDVLFIPNGDTCHYEVASQYLLRVSGCNDAFGNLTDFEWTDLPAVGQDPPRVQMVVTQYFDTSLEPVTNEITVVFDAGTMNPMSMSYDGDTWTYGLDGAGRLIAANPPEEDAGSWTFSYSSADGLLESLTTPHGGTITYQFGTRTYPGPGTPEIQYQTMVLEQRTTGGREPIEEGTWSYEYEWDFSYAMSLETRVTTPSGRVVYRYGWPAPGAPPPQDPREANPYSVFGAEAGLAPLRERVIQEDDGGWVDVQTEVLKYRWLKVLSWWDLGTLEVTERKITRKDSEPPAVYTTTYVYDVEDLNTNFAHFHRPKDIIETGTFLDGGGNPIPRTTTRTYSNPTSSPYLAGLLTKETIGQTGSDTFERSWKYDSQGFKEEETVYGIKTVFVKANRGNVASVKKANGKTTILFYEYGQPRVIATPEHTITRSINPDGTIASETRAGRTTAFEYDDLGRPKSADPPGETTIATVIDYDAGGEWVRTTRGASQVTTYLDGFGRRTKTTMVATPNAGTETTTRYDAEGRIIHEGYPVPIGATSIGTTISYDVLGRVKERVNPDSSFSTREYGPNGLVTITNERNKSTVQAWQAFGDPDESRLAGVIDADQKVWSYAYNTLGRLTGVTAEGGEGAPGPVTRTWTYYPSSDLLHFETHPEWGSAGQSGTTAFEYDFGVLRKKTDAKGIETTYTYDGNDRVKTITADGRLTTITYEAGSDNRTFAINASGGVIWHYDAATGRLQSRQDAIGGKLFTTAFEYDGNDNVRVIQHPSGRRVKYDVDAAGRPTRIYEAASPPELATDRDYATQITYHPSGGVASYVSNGLTHQIGYHPNRYWVTSINSGALQLTYQNYDGVGNPQMIGDDRAEFTQTLSYDALDRLTSAAGVLWKPSYSYDVHGNRTGPGYQYQAGKMRLASQDGISFSYDDNGNTLTAGTATFTYTPQNQVETAATPGVSATYAYDADDQRVKKTVGTSTTYFVRGASGELLTEWKDPGTAGGRTRDYVYLGTRLLSAVAKNRTDDPTDPNAPPTQSHKWATSWQVPHGNGDNVTSNNGISSAARKTFHPDMPSTGLRLGAQPNNVTVGTVRTGPLFPNSGNLPKQGGFFIEFEVERRPLSSDAEWLSTAGGVNSTDDLRIYITPAGALVVKHDDGRVPATTLYTSGELGLFTTHTLELRFEYNSYGGPYAMPNPLWENLTSRAQVFLDGAPIAVAEHGASAGGSWDSPENNPIGLDYKMGSATLGSIKLKSPASDNGLLMNVFRAGHTSAATHADTLDPYGNTWRTTLLQVAGPGTYSQWTGGQPDWRAHSAVHSQLGSLNSVTTTASNQKISYLMESMASRGITGKIGVVMIGIRNPSATSGSQAFIRRNGVDTMLPDLTLPSNPNTGMRWYRVSEGGWSPTDTIEVGLMSGASGTSSLTSVAVMVEHNTPEPAPLTDTGTRVITVNYTGNGTGQTIDLGVNMLPTALLVMPSTGATGIEPLIWWDGRLGAGGFSEVASTFGRVWPQKGKLQVVHPSDAQSYNANGVNYTAIVLFDPSGRYVIPFGVSKPSAEDNYTHHLRLPQTGELAATFTPDFVFGGLSSTTNADTNYATFYKGAGQAADSTARLGVAQAGDADRIQSMAAGQVQFGKLIGSQYGDTSFFAGRVHDGVATERLMAVTSYVGDGTASRNISLDLNGENPVFALVVPLTQVAKVYRVAADTTGRESWSGNAVPNSITAMGANQITVGNALNGTGVTYDVWAIRPGLVAPW